MGLVVKLHFGVVEIPYDNSSDAVTTGDVAEWLEENYEVLETFYQKEGVKISNLLDESLAGHLENVLAGAPSSGDPFAEACSEIHHMFVAFLTTMQMNGEPGVPTMRSLKGVSKRLKKKKGSPRPSFIDTGLYMAAMRAWVSEVKNA